MMRILIPLFLGLLALFHSLPLQANDSVPCELAVPCPVGDRSFHARLPDNWDGKSPLPVLLHFHGWGRQGPLIMKHGRIAGATRKLGVLLLAPNGQGKTWNFWRPGTPDVDFARAVLDEAARRWPIDRSRIFVSGYSYGSAMAWRFACAAGSRINTVLAVSGTIPDQSESCEAPVNVRHVHGTRDTVMDYPFGPQGEVEGAVALWLKQNGCEDTADSLETWQAVKILSFQRHRWDNCFSGKSIVLDVHKRGHFIPRFWIERQLNELL
ncbi:MAG: alpha/beta hydrolase family esterase [Rhizobiaceae bacterium]